MIDTWQKTITFFLILILPLFIIANFTFIKTKREPPTEWRTDFIAQDAYLPEKPFVFLVEGKNNAHYEQNLSTIFEQKYENYRVIYVMSPSINRENIEQFVAKKGKTTRLTIVESSDPELLQKALHLCKDEEIVIQIASSDWLAHENVLIKLNGIYTSSEEIWLTHSQYLEYPSYKKGSVEPYLKKMLRNKHSQKTPWVSSHFKTYYAGLFKQIQPLSQKKEFFDYLIPLAERAKNHIVYVDDILYIHNTGKKQHVRQNTEPPPNRQWKAHS